eukprot:g14131.t1
MKIRALKPVNFRGELYLFSLYLSYISRASKIKKFNFFCTAVEIVSLGKDILNFLEGCNTDRVATTIMCRQEHFSELKERLFSETGCADLVTNIETSCDDLVTKIETSCDGQCCPLTEDPRYD